MMSFNFLVFFLSAGQVKVKYKKFISRPLVLYLFSVSPHRTFLFSPHSWCICSTTCMLCISSLSTLHLFLLILPHNLIYFIRNIQSRKQ